MNILITGGAGALGKILASEFFHLGYNIYVIDKVPKNKIEQKYLEMLKSYHEVDLSKIEQIEEYINYLNINGINIDVLINNAAVRDFKLFFEFSEEDVFKNIKANFEAPLFLTRELLPKMIQNNFGRIINISSISGLIGYLSGTLYCSTKSALITYTEALAKDLGNLNKNITVNAILPDSFLTREGKKLKNYTYITDKIIFFINEFVSSNSNGKVKIVSPLKNRIMIFLKVTYNNFIKIL